MARHPEKTRRRLVEAAADLFNQEGFDGTDTNRIAAAAGFSPQTFYRHFEDKVDIFLRVYESWQDVEFTAVAASLQQSVRAAARTILQHHEQWRGFRRSLRHLAVSEPKVRQARAASRRRQIALLLTQESPTRVKERVSAHVLAIERWCDAWADGELSDLGMIDEGAWLEVIASELTKLLEISSPPDLNRA